MTVNVGPYVLMEIPVMTALVAGVAAWLIKRLVSTRDTADARRDAEMKDQSASLAEQSRALAIMLNNQPILNSRLDQLERTQSTLRETTASLAAILERHENWHERNDPRRVG